MRNYYLSDKITNLKNRKKLIIFFVQIWVPKQALSKIDEKMQKLGQNRNLYNPGRNIFSNLFDYKAFFIYQKMS